MTDVINVATAPRTATFQMRINPEIKSQVEQVFANCGLTLPEAINIFIQQSLNAKGLPFLVSQNTAELQKTAALARLFNELEQGRASVKSEADWLSEDEMWERLGVGK